MLRLLGEELAEEAVKDQLRDLAKQRGLVQASLEVARNGMAARAVDDAALASLEAQRLRLCAKTDSPVFHGPRLRARQGHTTERSASHHPRGWPHRVARTLQTSGPRTLLTEV